MSTLGWPTGCIASRDAASLCTGVSREQFAQEYTGKDADKDFKKKFVPALKKVLAVYPQAKVKPVTGGVRCSVPRRRSLTRAVRPSNANLEVSDKRVARSAPLDRRLCATH
ncbi:hypothetical protein VEE57_45280 (plasmid) [Escherichia coli]|nr:hypothetical protein VEE57_45280 [Escherichia coli]